MNVLFLCTGNSARSILAEAILRHVGAGRVNAFSAGSAPRGAVHPVARETLARHGHSLEGLRSKSWDEFAAPGAPVMDVVITVCDRAAAEVCPAWPGHPAREHWSLEDPAAARGSDDDVQQAFEGTYEELSRRISTLVQGDAPDPPGD